jgi:hypothetical protein
MIKEIIFFTNIALFQQCELEARKLGMAKGNDFIIKCTQGYFSTKSGEAKEFKKVMDMWIALDAEAKIKGIKIAELVERICDETLNPKPILPESPATEARKGGILNKINDAMSLPRG